MNLVKDAVMGLIGQPVKAEAPKRRATLDSVAAAFDSASSYAEKDIELKAVAAVQQWTENDSLDEGETYADRLLALLIGIADQDKNGELSEDEQLVVNVALNAAFDYLVLLGVAEDDAEALLSDWSPDVADRVRELVASGLPEGDEEALEQMDAFVFGQSDQEPALDAVYKNKMAIRNGRKVRIKKRISGHTRLTAHQKVAVQKMQRRAHSAAANAKRMKSMRVARSMGL